MTPPINSVSDDELIAQLRRLVDDQEGGDAVVLVQRQLFNRVVGRLAARRAANTPVSEWVYLVHDWEINEPGQRGYSYARTPERAERLAKNGVKLTPVYTRHPASDFSASPALPSQLVGVTELVWEKSNAAERWTASYAFGMFEITHYNEGYVWQRGICSERFASLEAAQSAVQADFNARIQSCLTSPAAERPCTCHPDDNPPQPCAQKFALADCLAAAEPVPDFWALWTVSGAHVGTWAVQETALRVAQEYRDCTIVPLYTHPAPSASREVTEADIERAAEAMWRAEVQDIGAARRAREAEYWADQSEEMRGKWLRFARAALTLPERGM